MCVCASRLRAWTHARACVRALAVLRRSAAAARPLGDRSLQGGLREGHQGSAGVHEGLGGKQ
eukprot:3440180-Pleurochrysis_carterae.AAC.1